MAVLKDLDFAESGEVVINPMAEDVKPRRAGDIEFLERNRLIDYSMMLGLHYKKNKDDEVARRERERERAAETEAFEPEPPEASDRGTSGGVRAGTSLAALARAPRGGHGAVGGIAGSLCDGGCG